MARIELRDTTIRIKDGMTGTAAVNDMSISGSDTTLEIDTLANLPNSRTTVPVGTRFTIDTVADTTFTVTAANSNEQQTVSIGTQTGGTFTLTFGGQETGNLDFDATSGEIQTALEGLSTIGAGNVVVTGSGPWLVEFVGDLASTDVAALVIDGANLTGGSGEAVTVTNAGATTWQLTFTPALDGGDLPSNDDVITFLPIQIEVKIGDGNLTYTENKEYEYQLDRGNLDAVREGDEIPMDVNIDFVYEFIRTGTNENITPIDALKGKGGAIDWNSTSTDPCEPYCVDIEVVYDPPCGTSETETTLFPEFRYDTINPDLDAATISVVGRCNATEPVITRS